MNVWLVITYEVHGDWHFDLGSDTAVLVDVKLCPARITDGEGVR